MNKFLILILILFMNLSLAQAQHKPGSSMLLLNVGFTSASPEDSDNELGGNTFTLNYESSGLDGHLVGGVSVGYMTTSADSLNAGKKVGQLNSVSYDVLPIMLYGRYMFGPDQLRGYIGAGFGIQFSNGRFFTDNVQVDGSDSGLLIGGMAGVNYFFNHKIFINGNYNVSWLGNSYFKDGMAQNFTIGLGFQFF